MHYTNSSEDQTPKQHNQASKIHGFSHGKSLKQANISSSMSKIHCTRKEEEGKERGEHASGGALLQCPSLSLQAIGLQAVGIHAYTHVARLGNVWSERYSKRPPFPSMQCRAAPRTRNWAEKYGISTNKGQKACSSSPKGREGWSIIYQDSTLLQPMKK